MVTKCERCGGLDTKGAKYQNEKYGWGMRVHNQTDKGQRCTVCGTEKSK